MRAVPASCKLKVKSLSERLLLRSGIVCFCLSCDLRPGGGSPTMERPPEKQEDAGAGEPEDRISLHNFCGYLAEQRVHFHSMRLRDSLFLWIGEGSQLSNLAVAMCTPRDSIPASTLLFGDTSDSTANSLAQRLASKTKKQIFVSYNIQNTDSSFILLVENRIKEEMAAFPEKF